MCAALKGNLEAVQFFLSKKADLTARDSHGRTALAHAAQAGHSEVAQALIKAGAEPDERLVGGWTELMIAAVAGDVAAAKKALAAGDDVNAATKDPPGYTALHVAANGGREDAIRLLLENKADFTAKDFNHQTPLAIATKRKFDAIVDLLQKAGAKE